MKYRFHITAIIVFLMVSCKIIDANSTSTTNEDKCLLCCQGNSCIKNGDFEGVVIFDNNISTKATIYAATNIQADTILKLKKRKILQVEDFLKNNLFDKINEQLKTEFNVSYNVSHYVRQYISFELKKDKYILIGFNLLLSNSDSQSVLGTRFFEEFRLPNDGLYEFFIVCVRLDDMKIMNFRFNGKG